MGRLRPTRDELGPNPGEPTTEELRAEHWQYVRAILGSYGIERQDADDVAQTVWMHVHRRRKSYRPTKHKTRRAWLTGFVARCAANHRRAARRWELRAFGSADEVPAGGLDPEQRALVRELHRLIPDDEKRTALLLQIVHGLSVAEIAAVQEVTESVVEWRLTMARKELRSADDEKKSGAYLGFGSLEALAEALKSPPLPEEVGRQEWAKIAERIRQEDASQDHEGTPTHDTDPPPPSSFPPAAALPVVSFAVPAQVTLRKGPFAGLVLLTFVLGAGVGAGSALAWRALEAGRQGRAQPTMHATAAASAVASISAAASSSTPSTSEAPSTRTASAAPMVTSPFRVRVPPSVTSVPPVAGPPVASAAESKRILAQMREALLGRQFSTVLTLAGQHAQRCGAMDRSVREAMRIQALQETGRARDAEQHARAFLALHPEHRSALERAAGRALR